MSKVNKKAPKGKEFYLEGGKILHSIGELRDELLHMNKKVFHHHCNKAKNDFSSWIKDVFNAKELAVSIRKGKTTRGIRIIITKYGDSKKSVKKTAKKASKKKTTKKKASKKKTVRKK